MKYRVGFQYATAGMLGLGVLNVWYMSRPQAVKNQTKSKPGSAPSTTHGPSVVGLPPQSMRSNDFKAQGFPVPSREAMDRVAREDAALAAAMERAGVTHDESDPHTGNLTSWKVAALPEREARMTRPKTSRGTTGMENDPNPPPVTPTKAAKVAKQMAESVGAATPTATEAMAKSKVVKAVDSLTTVIGEEPSAAAKAPKKKPAPQMK
jgi:hypothetical protein